ncbi:MAG: class I SAM-dependent methyltransferase, partial [Patescibacteria group bacterium]
TGLKPILCIGETAEDLAVWIKRVLEIDMENPGTRDLLEVNIIREQILRHANKALLDPELKAGKKVELSSTKFDMEGFSGQEQLFFMNNELKKITAMPPTIENFQSCQFILSRYLSDEVPSGDRLAMSEQVISDGLAQLYNNQEFSLRDYEGKTTDTSLSLTKLLESIDEMTSQKATGDPEERLVYDIGAGDGRIAIPLALSGCKVVGIDYSERMVNDSKTRPEEFRQSYNDSNDHLVNSAKKAFEATGKIVDEKGLQNIGQKVDIRHGNFFDFDAGKFKESFGERQPDAVIIMWHTLGFAGDVDRMQQVLKNAFDILRPGGRIFIEMPDRNFGGYARAIRDFHNSHPDLPFGAIEDAPSKSSDSPTEQDKSKATWRYFPKNSEIEDSLQSVGFDTSVAMMESYFVKAQAESNAKLLIKENMFMAEKPLDPDRLSKLTDYAKTLSDDKKRDEERIEELREQIKAA